MSANLKDIEKKLQSFFEEQLQRLSSSDPLKMAASEILSAQLNSAIDHNQKRLSPNIFRITFRDESKDLTNDLDSWKLLMVELIKESAREHNLHLSGPVHIQNFFDSSISEAFTFEVAFSSSATSETRNLPVGDNAAPAPANKQSGYLITAHDTIFPLNKKVISIGREEGNDLVIDNLRVSRLHAQIREIGNEWIVFDVNSTTGTKVNNLRISQHKLSNGDVLEIADVVLIFSNDPPPGIQISNSPHTTIIPIQGKE